MTWYELKLATLQKMFATTGAEIVEDESNREYLEAMPGAANEGMAMLATGGRGIQKPVQLVVPLAENLLGDNAALMQAGTGFAFEAAAQSWTLEATGPAVGTVQLGDGAPEPFEVAGAGFGVYAGVVDNPDGLPLRVTLEAPTPVFIRSVAMYAGRYAGADAVPGGGAERRWDLRAVVDDFYRLKEDSVYFEGAAPGLMYDRRGAFRWEGESTFVAPARPAGCWTVYYYAYPALFGQTTPDDTRIPLAQEECVLLPLYMASQLYKDDDLALSTVYRNEFEVGLERLRGNANVYGHEEFTSRWI